ncbi:hypothetical protein QC762_602445 [Podospora pseudocomata]|uniref:ABC transporter domain-containing protein n=1 Tax=Podospora pseudocomata TaxID=2093779 RepID=A0ABR0GGE2_9PEZI|nr:hypothetical protein QC762_602445 [Podospora pseudocomata]
MTLFGNLREALKKAASLRRMLERECAVRDGSEAFEPSGGHIEFVDVSFAYPEKVVLENCNLSFQSGKITAVVGPSGVGKSTILKLILRAYDPQIGLVKIDGQDIRIFRLQSLRSRMAVMEQEPRLFNRTILENVKYGRQGATDEEVREACKKANIHDCIMSREKGYHEVLSCAGSGWSGGERQRFGLARLFVQNPDIIIVDEGTSAIDTETETQVNMNLREWFQGKTTILIAHRLSSVMHAHNILFLSDNGQVCEEGTHQDLIARKGGYYSLFQHYHGNG